MYEGNCWYPSLFWLLSLNFIFLFFFPIHFSDNVLQVTIKKMNIFTNKYIELYKWQSGWNFTTWWLMKCKMNWCNYEIWGCFSVFLFSPPSPNWPTRTILFRSSLSFLLAFTSICSSFLFVIFTSSPHYLIKFVWHFPWNVICSISFHHQYFNFGNVFNCFLKVISALLPSHNTHTHFKIVFLVNWFCGGFFVFCFSLFFFFSFFLILLV